MCVPMCRMHGYTTCMHIYIIYKCKRCIIQYYYNNIISIILLVCTYDRFVCNCVITVCVTFTQLCTMYKYELRHFQLVSWDGNFVIAPLFAVADVFGDRKLV